MHIENRVGIMSVTCLFGKGKALFLSTAQAAPQTNYKIKAIQHKHTIHINKQQTCMKRQRVGFINLFCVCCSLGSKILGVMA